MEIRAHRTWLTWIVRFFYRVFGPTTVHLEHEICLFVTTAFLTSASLFSLYGSSFGLSGDCLYLFFTNLWLSRHFVHRLICTTDVGTSLSPWTRNLRWVWIIITSGGQYFDVPTSIFASTSYQPLLDDYSRPKGGRDIISDVSGSIPVTSSSPLAFHRLWIVQKSVIPLLAASWALGKILKSKLSPRNVIDFDDEDWATTPASSTNKRNKHSSSSGSDHVAKSRAEKDSFAHSHDKCKKKLNRKLDMWCRFVPQIQLLVLIGASCGIIWFIQQYMRAMSSYVVPLRSGRIPTGDGAWASPQFDTSLNSEFMRRKFEGVQGAKAVAALRSRNFVYSPYGMMCMIAAWGTIGCLFLYGRIMLPLPDLVAGVVGSTGKGSYVSLHDEIQQFVLSVRVHVAHQSLILFLPEIIKTRENR